MTPSRNTRLLLCSAWKWHEQWWKRDSWVSSHRVLSCGSLPRCIHSSDDAFTEPSWDQSGCCRHSALVSHGCEAVKLCEGTKKHNKRQQHETPARTLLVFHLLPGFANVFCSYSLFTEAWTTLVFSFLQEWRVTYVCHKQEHSHADVFVSNLLNITITWRTSGCYASTSSTGKTVCLWRRRSFLR